MSVGFTFERLLLERKGHYPLPFSSILDNPKGDDLKGRGEETAKMNLFYLSSVARFMLSLWNFFLFPVYATTRF